MSRSQNRLAKAVVIGLALSGASACAVLQGMVDTQARDQCEDERPSERGACLDRQEAREREQRS